MKETLAYLQSFVVMALVLTGLAGIAYHLFRDGGWIEQGLGKIFGYTMQYPLIVTFVVIGGLLFAWWWRHDRLSRGSQSMGPTLVLYSIMAAGAYFIGHFAIYGSF